MKQSEKNSALRTIPLYLADTSGNGVTGISFSVGDVKIHKYNGSWINSANLPVEDVGGLPGSYTLQLHITETNTLGPLFIQIVNGSIKNYVTYIFIEDERGSFTEKEPIAALRCIPLFVIDSSGNGVGGVSWSTGDFKIHKHGGSWTSTASLPVDLSGTAPGSYVLQLLLEETDTSGELLYQATNSAIVDLVSAITISPARILPDLPISLITWDYSGLNNEIFDQGSPLATNKRVVRTTKDLLSQVSGFSVDYSCNGSISGVKGDGVDRWASDSDIKYGNGTSIPGSWFVCKFSEVYNSEILITPISSGSTASAAILSGTVTIKSLLEGSSQNLISIVNYGDSAPAGGVTVDESGSPAIVVHYESGVSTRQDVVDAINLSSSLVTASVGSATVLTSPIDNDVGPQEWSNIATATDPANRDLFSMSYDRVSHEIVMFGGSDGAGGELSDTWTWNGLDWTQEIPATTPTARHSGAQVYSSLLGKTLLFGGFNSGSGFLGDTWTWDGSDWSSAPAASSPSPRYGHALAIDPITGFVILYGGTDAGALPLADTWAYNGATWSLLSAGPNPTARYYHAMTLHEASGKIVLFAGQTNTSRYQDTWTWDGTAWSLESPATVPTVSASSKRTRHSLEYDSLRGVSVLFGGRDVDIVNSFLHDTWEWSGSDWTASAATADPGGRQSPGLAYDRQHEQMIAFGGSDPGGLISTGKTWRYYGTPLFLSNGADNIGGEFSMTFSRSAGFTGGSVTTFPTASDQSTPSTPSSSSTLGDQYVLHLIKESNGSSFRLAIYSPAGPFVINLDKIPDPPSGWLVPAVFGTFPGPYDTEFGPLYGGLWPGYAPSLSQDIEGFYDLYKAQIFDAAGGYLGHVSDIIAGSNLMEMNIGDYVADIDGNRWVVIGPSTLALWSDSAPDLIAAAGVSPTPKVLLGKIIADEIDSSNKYRMRAFDGTLAETVYWSANRIDSTGSLYTGPGPLTHIVVSNVINGE